MATKSQSVRAGSDPNERRVIAAATGTTAAPAPTEMGFNLQSADFMSVFVAYVGMTAATITPWFWSDAAGLWFQGEDLVFTATERMALVQVQAASRVFFQVTAVTGAGSVSVWAEVNSYQSTLG